MLRYVLIAGLLMIAPVAAQEVPDGLATKIAEQAYECWSILPSERFAENLVVLDMNLTSLGEVEGTPSVIKAPRGGYGIERSAQRAAMACAPYKFKEYDYTGTVRITLVPKTQ